MRPQCTLHQVESLIWKNDCNTQTDSKESGCGIEYLCSTQCQICQQTDGKFKVLKQQ